MSSGLHCTVCDRDRDRDRGLGLGLGLGLDRNHRIINNRENIKNLTLLDLLTHSLTSSFPQLRASYGRRLSASLTQPPRLLSIQLLVRLPHR